MPRKRTTATTRTRKPKAPRTNQGAEPINRKSVNREILGDGTLIPHLTDSAVEPDDVALAKKALRNLIDDRNTPAAAVASAARILLELSGAIGRNAKAPSDGSKPVNELTRAELEAELAGL